MSDEEKPRGYMPDSFMGREDTMMRQMWARLHQEEEAEMTATVEGVDVYNGDGTINWQAAKDARQVFGYCKATEGLTLVDHRLQANMDGMKAAGILRGAYCFFRMNLDPVQQANHFVNAIRDAGYNPCSDMPPCVDIEEDSVAGGSYTSAQVVAALAAFNRTVEQVTGRRNLIYVDRSVAEEYLQGGTPFSGHDLWLAQYTNSPVPHLPYGWKTWRFWQYSEYGTVAGLPNRGGVDRDRYNGTESDLCAWALQLTADGKSAPAGGQS